MAALPSPYLTQMRSAARDAAFQNPTTWDRVIDWALDKDIVTPAQILEYLERGPLQSSSQQEALAQATFLRALAEGADMIPHDAPFGATPVPIADLVAFYGPFLSGVDALLAQQGNTSDAQGSLLDVLTQPSIDNPTWPPTPNGLIQLARLLEQYDPSHTASTSHLSEDALSDLYGHQQQRQSRQQQGSALTFRSGQVAARSRPRSAPSYRNDFGDAAAIVDNISPFSRLPRASAARPAPFA